MKLNKEIRTGFLNVLCMAGLLASIIMMPSCNRSFPSDGQKLRNDYPNDTASVNDQNRKVLYIIIDGAQGTEIKTLAPTNLTKMYRSSIYTFYGISGFYSGDTTLTGAWTSMLTGVTTKKSAVNDGFGSANLGMYPSIVTRLKNVAPNKKVVAFSSSALFSQNLTNDATVNTLFENNDESVANAVVADLKSDSASLVIGQFHSVAVAGDTYGYGASIPQYASAINTVDTYIGNIMAALKARPNYSNEKWMVVIASNENGKINTNTSGDFTAFGDSRKNSFILFYSPRFNSDIIPKPSNTKGFSAYNDSTLLLTGTGSTGTNITIPKNSIYNIVQGSQGTIEFKFKILNTSLKGSGYLNLVANGGGFVASPNGWSFWVDGGTLKFFFGDGNGHYINTNSAAQIKDGNWHTACMTFNLPNGSNTLSANLYIDGVLDRANLSVNNVTNITPSNSITIGSTPNQSGAGNYTDYYVTDFRYWNVALPSNIVALYNCQNTISVQSPYINNLVANYRINDGNNSHSVTDLSPNHLNATVNDPSNHAKWQSFDEISNAICPAADDNYYKIIINGLDIPFQIYQWLGVPISSSWKLDGQYWNSGYVDLALPDQY